MSNNLIRSFPEQEGIDSRLILDFLNASERAGAEIHGIMILRHNKVIFEAYNAPYQADIPHIMHSFTKCLTNTAVGLAYTNGLLTLDDPILKHLPEYAPGASDYLKKATIRNLITMRSGQERSIGGNEWRPLKTSWLDAYFKVQFVEEPGSKYMYSSGNSYVLSAIVQRLTGKTCREYIRSIGEKIGLSDFTWSLSPEGICSGGNGTSLTVEDMARIGLFYLNKGRWNGEQLLAEEWVDLAFGYRENIPFPAGMPEYNFHWQHTGDIWAACGMFGQTCAVIPSLDMVVAFTAADNTYATTPILQTTLIDGSKVGGQLEETNWNILRDKGLRMTLEGRHQSLAAHYIPTQKSYDFSLDGTIDQITHIRIDFSDDAVSYSMTDHRGCHTIKAGLDHWLHGETSMTGAYLHHQYEVDTAKVSACAYWSAEKTLMMEWRYPEMAFFDHCSITWEGDKIRINRWVNMNSQDLSRPELIIPLL